MSRAGGQESCEPGAQWDNLLRLCIPSSQSPSNEPEPRGSPLVVQQRTWAVLNPNVLPAGSAPVVQQRTGMVLSPLLCTFVALATLGSILVLAVWCFLYRKHSSRSRASVGGGGDEEEGQQEPLQKAEPPSEGMSRADALPGAAEAGPPCPHLQPDPQAGLQWQEGGMKRELARATWMEGRGGLPRCSKVQEHRIPLPATELGGTALVTTKTVKEGD
ncbi:uncharacterized protein LOC142892250 isoform X2 [Nelusetta ayraudi]|uniref:uncharacterized protein LOC142892250 isoform X2 n=1 Tax=Nelusetta ayraudi TaxID=303726 RepID=UPI003F71E6BD